MSVMSSLKYVGQLMAALEVRRSIAVINANQHLSLPHTDSEEDDFELSTVCHRPESMDKLQEQTKFTKKELQVLYRGFKNVGLAEEESDETG